jgi:hypothetical protein
VAPGQGHAGAALDEAALRARSRLSEPPDRTSDGADAALDDLEVLWRLTATACPDAATRDPVLGRVMSLALEREAR